MDDCPNGDYTSSYYDKDCGTPPPPPPPPAPTPTPTPIPEPTPIPTPTPQPVVPVQQVVIPTPIPQVIEEEALPTELLETGPEEELVLPTELLETGPECPLPVKKWYEERWFWFLMGLICMSGIWMIL
jgi:hypothetical protein